MISKYKNYINIYNNNTWIILKNYIIHDYFMTLIIKSNNNRLIVIIINAFINSHGAFGSKKSDYALKFDYDLIITKTW